MVILFLEYLVDSGGTLETLYMGLAVGVVILASVYASNSMKEPPVSSNRQGDNDDGLEHAEEKGAQ